MKIPALLCVVAILAVSPAFAAEEKSVSCKPVATVYGQDICEADISPGAEIEEQIRTYTTANGENPDKALRGVRLTNLFGQIWEKNLIQKYGKDAITPSKAEVENYLKAMRASMKKQYQYDQEISDLLVSLMKENVYGDEDVAKMSQLGMDKRRSIMFYDMRAKIPAEMKSQMEKGERDMAEAMVKSWKVKKLLYSEYGGQVSFQQAGLEPIDAFKKVFAEIKDSKDIVVHDKAYNDVYDAMEDYLDEDHQIVPSDGQDVREYFESPTWLYDSGVAEEAHKKTKEMILAIPHEKAKAPEAEKKEEKKEEKQ